MISQLTGKIININDKSLIIDVNGIGYQVFCSSQTIFQFKNIDDTVTILTELIVREDSLTLFGFSDLNEKEWFNLLVSVQGVGAKACFLICLRAFSIFFICSLKLLEIDFPSYSLNLIALLIA